MIVTALLATLAMAAPSPSLRNPDFRDVANGQAVAWSSVGRYAVEPSGGYRGAPALALRCDGSSDSGAEQTVAYPSGRRGAFRVSAWVRCEKVEDGGDCGVWLDVVQKDGPPIWGQLGAPYRSVSRWQQVHADVHPTHPVAEVRVYLLLRKTRGVVRLSNVRMTDIPVAVRDLRAAATGPNTCEVRAHLTDAADWTVSVKRAGAPSWTTSGTGTDISCSPVAQGSGPYQVRLIASLPGQPLVRRAVTASSVSATPVTFWIESSMTRVFQDDLPPANPARSATVDLPRGGTGSFQVCLRATGRPVSIARISLSALRSLKGGLPIGCVTWNRVGYIHIARPYAHPYAERTTSAWWPDPLLAPRPFGIDANQTQPVWITVRAPRRSQPGTYTSSIVIRTSDARQLKVPVSVRVYATTLPVEPHIKTAFALMDGYLRNLYGTITPALRRRYTDVMLQHHLNPDDISRTTPPDMSELAYANSRGLNAFNILNAVPEPDRPVTWVCTAPLDAYTLAFQRRFLERLDAVVPQLRRQRLLQKAYVYGFDERGPEYNTVIRDLFGAIKRRYPEIHTLSTCWPTSGTDPMSLNVDWYVPLSSAYNPAIAKAVRARGGEMWWYICMGPNYPYANWLIENPLIEGRVIWWQAYRHGVEGFLYWGVNIWEREHNDRPIPADAGPRISWSVTTGGDYPSLNGDGVLLYPGESGPLASIRLAAIRDGIEDTELLRAYKVRFGGAASDAVAAKVTRDRTSYTRDPALVVRLRRELLRKLR